MDDARLAELLTALLEKHDAADLLRTLSACALSLGEKRSDVEGEWSAVAAASAQAAEAIDESGEGEDDEDDDDGDEEEDVAGQQRVGELGSTSQVDLTAVHEDARVGSPPEGRREAAATPKEGAMEKGAAPWRRTNSA
jgi:hypothetical protein